MSEAAIRSGSGSRGGEERRPARKRPARSGSRASPAARRSPGRPSSSARQTGRPIAPSPTTPTLRVFCMTARDDIMRASARMRRASALREPLERLYREFDYAVRVERDALRFPLRYPEPHDRELVALLSACLADGRGPIGPPLERFARAFLEADLREVFPRGRLSRGYRHLFPLPSVGGPCKRLHLFLRWMVRREAPDVGLWTTISPSRLLMPIDTHVENMSRAIGLTRRRSRNWRMAEEITARLVALDPADPVKYDFALCHTRMAGDCRDRRDPVVCPPCGLRAVCRHWSRRRG